MDLRATHGAVTFRARIEEIRRARKALAILALIASITAHAQVDNVDPGIGSVSLLLEPTRPTVSLPNSMVRVYPIRRDGVDDQIRFFPLTIISHRLGELFWLLPCSGKPQETTWYRALACDQEKLTPYYYWARLEDSQIQIEFTPSFRCGYFRFTVPAGTAPVVLLANRQEGDLKGTGPNVVTGVERFNNMQAFVYGEFNRPVSFVVTNEAGKSHLTVEGTNMGPRDHGPTGLQDQGTPHPGPLPSEGEKENAVSAPVSPAPPTEQEKEPAAAEPKSGHKRAFSWLFPKKGQAGGAALQQKPAVNRTADLGNVIEFRYGISFISEEQARKNLNEEIPGWDFEGVKLRARDYWNQALGQIQVDGGTLAQRRVFYSALYRCCERMVNITEDGQYYSGFDHKVHDDIRPFYVDNGLWDTYRALEPLETLLNPEMQADKIESYVRMYQQSGWMPSFAVLWGNYACMIGNHAAAWMADAWFKGVHDFDLKTGYDGIRKTTLEGTLLPWRIGPKCSLDDFYNEHGYFPALRPAEKETVALVNPFEHRQAVSVTLEQSYDDWCTAQIARVLHKDEDYQLFLKRAANYQHVYRKDKGFMWPKDADGNWIEPFDPQFSGGQGGRDYTTENNIYTYNWDVQHDLKGLAALMGGNHAAEAKLDQMFRADLGRSKYEFLATFPDMTGLIGEFSIGNQPGMVIPYIYNHLGAPWKTQKRIRQILDTWFTDTALGYPGDDDEGAMAAFVVFSMMGFYPVVPGVPTYELGSPVFDKVTLRLHNGKILRIVAKHNSPKNKYIRSVQINRQPVNRVWFTHGDVVKGMTIEVEMGDTPNRRLGAEEGSLPPSSMDFDPRTIQ